ncbi:MAG: ATP-binding cassette domain-containing protein [Coriobacteriales bacterium]|jgi:energy-coupling factor transport system ATP-binding protein|nr:ATP-binding cassette domain-containing protein [Coriobacteriales bacterium]
MLSFEQVSYRYQDVADAALANVTFSVAPGEHVVLLGSNGSGKSTLARLANGLLLPDKGSVRINGLSTSAKETIRTLRSQVGLIAQDPDNQIVSTTVLDEVAFGPENLGLKREEIIERVNAALQTLGLTGFEERDPNALSGGEKQRLIIASILAMNPAYLVLDEPTSMLDQKGRIEVRDAIRQLNARGHGIVHITHDLSFAREADRALVLQEGRLVFAGRPDALLANEALLVAYGLKAPWDTQLMTEPADDHLMKTLRPATAPKRRKERGGSFPSLCLSDVRFNYNAGAENEREVLKGVSFTIAPGSFTLITGDSGSGKSTLLRVLSGLLEPSSGAVTFSNGDRVFPSAVGIVFQHPESQLFAQTVEDEIAFGPSNLGLLPNKEARADVVREALGAVGLDPKMFFHRSPFSLSGGEMRRVAIASILATRPPFLLLDEPTAGLDAKGRAFIHTFIERLITATAGVVVVSHDVEEFRLHAQTHLKLQGGQLWRL